METANKLTYLSTKFFTENEEEYKYECLGGLRYKECIPYQGNEHLLGTNKSK